MIQGSDEAQRTLKVLIELNFSHNLDISCTESAEITLLISGSGGIVLLHRNVDPNVLGHCGAHHTLDFSFILCNKCMSHQGHVTGPTMIFVAGLAINLHLPNQL